MEGSKHRNPLFIEGTGITLDCIALDTLHTLHLGVVVRYVTAVFWHLLEQDAWRVPHGGDKEKIKRGVERLRVDLFGFYAKMRKNVHALSELHDLSLKMMGKRASLRMKAKAAESKWLLCFCVHELEVLKDHVPDGAAYLDGAKSLWRHMELMDELPQKLPPEGVKAPSGNIHHKTAAEACPEMGML